MKIQIKKSGRQVRWVAFASLVAVSAFSVSRAHAESKKKYLGNLKVPPRSVPAPDLGQLQSTDEAAFAALTTSKPSSSTRHIASDNKTTGSEDLMSKQLKEFRDQLVQMREAEKLDALLKQYDANYESLPNDLKFVIARMAPMISLRGVFWRLAPLFHQSVVGQESALSMLRWIAEQVATFEPDTQWEAYMAFTSIPSADLMQAPANPPHDGVSRKDRAFYVENDLVDYLGTEVYPALGKAIQRLQKLKMTQEIDGRSVMIVFDNRLRFGQKAFSESYDAEDRFHFVGDAERFSAIARFERRLSMIAQLEAYNWNGTIALRREISKKYGIDATLSGNWFNNNAFAIDGLTREERVQIVRGYHDVYTIRNKAWMPIAYHHLHMFGRYMNKSWSVIRNERDNYEMLLDPDTLQGKKEQNDKAMATLERLLPAENASGATTIQGAISGDTIQVDVKDFFQNPPSDLKTLMPTHFNHNEDIQPLVAVYGEKNIKISDDESVVKMTINGKSTEWRNYFYGRATGWNREAYATLFPGLQSDADVERALRVLGETRGGRPLLNTLAIFIK